FPLPVSLSLSLSLSPSPSFSLSPYLLSLSPSFLSFPLSLSLSLSLPHCRSILLPLSVYSPPSSGVTSQPVLLLLLSARLPQTSSFRHCPVPGHMVRSVPRAPDGRDRARH